MKPEVSTAWKMYLLKWSTPAYWKKMNDCCSNSRNADTFCCTQRDTESWHPSLCYHRHCVTQSYRQRWGHNTSFVCIALRYCFDGKMTNLVIDAIQGCNWTESIYTPIYVWTGLSPANASMKRFCASNMYPCPADAEHLKCTIYSFTSATSFSHLPKIHQQQSWSS